MITNFFIPELNNHDVQELWFQQDGATCHPARATIDLLKDTFGDRLISRFGPVNWPPRSWDLTTLDYFLRLKGGRLYARRPVVCVPLTRQYRTARLQWCREHHNWTEQDWACVLFSDESRFSLSLDCRRQLIWSESGTDYRPENIQEKDRYPTCSIMV
ncbi:retrovirus-related Pol polyprotein from transposon 297 [Trichonephila clavipes]|nr:retrovirus-related Pol polyprotein from transposon 297 [Trichonephila clavipes]